jgi:hypothetical protein
MLTEMTELWGYVDNLNRQRFLDDEIADKIINSTTEKEECVTRNTKQIICEQIIRYMKEAEGTVVLDMEGKIRTLDNMGKNYPSDYFYGPGIYAVPVENAQAAIKHGAEPTNRFTSNLQFTIMQLDPNTLKLQKNGGARELMGLHRGRYSEQCYTEQSRHLHPSQYPFVTTEDNSSYEKGAMLVTFPNTMRQAVADICERKSSAKVNCGSKFHYPRP